MAPEKSVGASYTKETVLQSPEALGQKQGKELGAWERLENGRGKGEGVKKGQRGSANM